MTLSADSTFLFDEEVRSNVNTWPLTGNGDGTVCRQRTHLCNRYLNSALNKNFNIKLKFWKGGRVANCDTDACADLAQKGLTWERGEVQ